MAEIDEKKPFESVHDAVALFEQKIDLQKYDLIRTGEKDKDLEQLMKELAYCKLQLEIKDSAYMHAVVKLDVYNKTLVKLSAQLKHSEDERDKYMEELKKSRAFIYMLEYEYEGLMDQLVDSAEKNEKFLCTVDEFKSMKEELFQLKTELNGVKESKVAALGKAELSERFLQAEKERNRELLVQVSELNTSIFSSNLAAIEADKIRSAFFSGVEAELLAATEAVVQFHKQLEEMKMQLHMVKDLGNKLLEKTVLADYYQLELMETKGKHATQMELMQNAISDERNYSMSLEAEVKQLDEEVQSANEKVSCLNLQTKALDSEVEHMKVEAYKSNERETELQVEIATLKSELHKSRSKIAAAEAAEARLQSSQSGLHAAVQQLALEAETAKKEVQMLKHQMDSGITIPVEQYESLIQKAKMVDEPRDEHPVSQSQSQSENKSEVDTLKEELQAASVEISDLRFALEDATRRADMAENAKSVIEDQLRKWREKQQQRRAAADALHEQSGRRSLGHEKPLAHKQPNRSASLQDNKVYNYIPLGKVLNMKY